MRATTVVDGPDLLGSWIDRTRRQRDLRNQITSIKGADDSPCRLRFAFYGRISTEDWQDKLSSARWQRDFAEELTAGHGTIVASFFDVGVSRRLPWRKRPQAARLLAALADPDRGFDAIVIGEFERAFFGDQLDQLAPIFQRHGVQIWLPELDGPIDFTDPVHLALVRLLAVHSKREVLRARYRALASMRAQVVEQGRNIGGRPPYGYQLVDAGPHPNKAHARWGRRLQRLEPDPATAPHVRWIFNQRLQGRSVAGIARALNEQNVPCPSAADAARNPHRAGTAWQLNTVAAILANPRYTGRQVWNRQHTDHSPDDHADDLLGRVEAQRWSPLEKWVISEQAVHPALVSEADFVAVQAVHTAPTPAGGVRRCFLLSGRLLCQLCTRPLDANWTHGRPAYRCRHGNTATASPSHTNVKQVYARQDQVMIFLAAHLDQLQTADPNASFGYTLDETTLEAYLRSHDLNIVCGYEKWTLYVGDELAAEAVPPRMAPLKNPRRARRRRTERRP